MKFKHKLEYILLRFIIFVINLLPVPAILALCSSVGMITWVIFPFRIRVAYKNLTAVFPELDHTQKLRLLRRVYIQFTRTFGLVFILHRKRMVNLIKNAEISGRDTLDAALSQGKGVILTTIHASWFEAYFAWFNLSNLPTSLIYQKQSNPLSDQYFVKQRERYGSSLESVSSRAGIRTFKKSLDKQYDSYHKPRSKLQKDRNTGAVFQQATPLRHWYSCTEPANRCTCSNQRILYGKRKTAYRF